MAERHRGDARHGRAYQRGHRAWEGYNNTFNWTIANTRHVRATLRRRLCGTTTLSTAPRPTDNWSVTWWTTGRARCGLTRYGASRMVPVRGTKTTPRETALLWKDTPRMFSTLARPLRLRSLTPIPEPSPTRRRTGRPTSGSVTASRTRIRLRRPTRAATRSCQTRRTRSRSNTFGQRRRQVPPHLQRGRRLQDSPCVDDDGPKRPRQRRPNHRRLQATPINSTTGKASWPHQALEPNFSWNNVGPGGRALVFNTGSSRSRPIATTTISESTAERLDSSHRFADLQRGVERRRLHQAVTPTRTRW